MQYFTNIYSYRETAPSAVTLGKFDSLHRGHQKLINKIREYADKEQVKSVVCAFDMHMESLLTLRERRERLDSQVDYLVQWPFTKEIREMEAETFIRKILKETFHAVYVVVGTDYHFGYKAKGDVHTLAEYADECGYHLDVIEKERYGPREISSTYVREALRDGDIFLANILLGYPYQITGRVEHGNRLGRKLGFPTMNVALDERKTIPKFGVYACRVLVDGIWHKGIGNVGVKPTVSEEQKPLVEVFVFDYDEEAYGKEITVEFCGFERPERKFHSIEELKAQIDADVTYGEKYFDNN